MKLKLLYLLSIALTLPLLTLAGKPPVVKWRVNKPFEQKVFIENKGQFSIPDKNVSPSDVSYGARVDGLHYYFTKNNIWISQFEPIKRSDSEIAVLKSQAGSDLTPIQKRGIEYRYEERFYQMNFINANPREIVASGQLSNYYTYGSSPSNSIKANAYKKIIYYDIYPGIDMEVSFPQDKDGFEYSFIVHPGADPSQIKIQYPLNRGITADKNGNMIIKSVFGSFTEHTPVANQAETSNAINCSFALNNGVMQIKPGKYNRGNTLKIDPWVLTPIPSSLFGAKDYPYAYDVDWDNGSNCYVLGGSYPWVVAKFDPSGNLLWTFTAQFSAPKAQFLGDFAVDRYSKSVYVGEGLNSNGAQIIKLNSAGKIMDSTASTMIEMWRIAFSRCVPHVGVIGGGSQASAPFYTGIALNPSDSNLTGLTPINVLNTANGYHDVCLLAVDDNAATTNAYMGFCSNSGGNNLIKTPLPNLNPVLWNKLDNYFFNVGTSVYYGFGTDSQKSEPNGFEGITYSVGLNLYTYDSYTLERWNTSNGAIVNTKAVNTPGASGNSLMHWGGLGSNTCNDVFLGTGTKIQEYDSLLATVGNPINEGDTVYSVKVGNYNLLYACGQNFVTVIQLDIPYCIPFTESHTHVNATCTQKGSVTITPGSGTASYNCILYGKDTAGVVQTALGQPGAITFSNLDSGTYVIDLTDTSCLSERIYDTVRIKKVVTYVPAQVIPNPAAICVGDSVQLTASLTTAGVATYRWTSLSLGYPAGLSDSSTATVWANPVVTTTYDLIAYMAPDCPDTVKAVVNVNPLPVITATPDSPHFCAGAQVAITLSGAGATGTYTWTPSTGLSASTGSTVTANPATTTTYTITATNANTCQSDTTIVVTVYPYPVVTLITDAQTICTGKSTTITANGASSYTWSPTTNLTPDTGSSVSASPAVTTTYIVTGTTHGCATNDTDTVTVLPLPTLAITALSPLYCINAQAVTLNGGGTPAGGYFTGTGVSSNAGDTTFNPATAGAGTFPITYTYTNSSGCTNSIDTQVIVAPLPVLSILPAHPVICSGLPITLTAEGASTYLWAPSGSTDSTTVVEISTPTRYLVTGTDSNGCIDTVSTLVGIGTLPDTGFVMKVPNQCNSLSVLFVSTDTTATSTYLWKFGDGTTTVGINPAHTFTRPSLQDTVTLYITNQAGCEDSTTHIEQVVSPPELAIFPDAFTPITQNSNKTNGTLNEQNEFFKPIIYCAQASGYIFRIYNRWGQMVYSSNDPNDPGWDGTFNGPEEPLGVYVYYMQFVCNGCSVERQGNVTLIR